MKAVKTVMQQLHRMIERENRRARRRQLIRGWIDKARTEFRRIFCLHSWRRCGNCGERLGWHGYTDHIPF